jgi:hypothetical protein
MVNDSPESQMSDGPVDQDDRNIERFEVSLEKNGGAPSQNVQP